MFIKCLILLWILKDIKKFILTRSPTSVENMVKPLKHSDLTQYKRINRGGQLNTCEEYAEELSQSINAS